MNKFKRTRGEKAITLIALIITIVVLLILAVVAIGAVRDGGILQHARNSTNEYVKKSGEESATLQGYADKIKDVTTKKIKWKDNGDGTFTSSDGVTVEIGDYVNYDEGIGYTHTPEVAKGAGTSQTGGNYTEGYIISTSQLTTENLSWRVLGISSEGELELISADSTSQNQKVYIANDEGYVNFEYNLNNFCNELYGKGTYAAEARSLNVEDIDKITNYDSTTYNGYGEKWIYRYPTQEEMDTFIGVENSTRYMQYSKDDGTTWNNITGSDYQTFRLPQDTIALSNTNTGSREVTESYYSYNIANNITTEDGYKSEKITEISNMISKGSSGTSNFHWLATTLSECNEEVAFFAGYVIHDGKISLNPDYLFCSYEYFNCVGFPVRPVVTISTEVSLSGSGSDVGSLTNMWEIK